MPLPLGWENGWAQLFKYSSFVMVDRGGDMSGGGQADIRDTRFIKIRHWGIQPPPTILRGELIPFHETTVLLKSY